MNFPGTCYCFRERQQKRPPMPDCPDRPSFDLDSFIPYRLSVVAKRASDEFARHYRDRFGLSVPEWRVLVHLLASGNVSVRDIEARVALERYEISRAAKRLRENGLIESAENSLDRRLVSLSLTAKGQALMAELIPLAEAYQAEIQTRLGAALEGFVAGLDRLTEERT